eukprot:SAG11_NODE_34134_length_273_cov_1.442529_1_plen_21_part_10
MVHLHRIHVHTIHIDVNFSAY